MQPLESKVPPVVIWGLCLLLSYWLAPLLAFSLSSLLQVILVTLFILIGCFLGFSGVYCFHKAHTTVNPHRPDATSKLVTTGVYKITRNPMYLSLVLWLVAYCIYLSGALSFIAIPAFVIYLNQFQIKPEEYALRKLFGDHFLEYQAKVRRWI